MCSLAQHRPLCSFAGLGNYACELGQKACCGPQKTNLFQHLPQFFEVQQRDTVRAVPVSVAKRYRASWCGQAERIMIDSEDNKEYLPIEGLAEFNKATTELLLGADNAAIREVTHNPMGAALTVLQHSRDGPSLFWFASLLRSR